MKTMVSSSLISWSDRSTSVARMTAGLLLLLPLLLQGTGGVVAGGVDPHRNCRSVDALTEPDHTADVIVIGSGPGGSGFLHKLLQETSTMTVLWLEKGPDRKVTNYPRDLVVDNIEPPVTPVQRRKMKWMQGLAWNRFGGGDAANSGGPNILGLVEQEVYAEEVFNLRNNSIVPMTRTTERWTQAFLDSGFEFVNAGPLRQRDRPLSNQVGRVSSLQTQDGRDRRVIAESVRANPQVSYVRARAASIVHRDGHATGVRGVRINDDNSPGTSTSQCVYWKANKAVVLAAGVLNSFNLLVDSGIGPEPDLQARNVPSDWWIVNEKIGANVGEELSVVYLSVEPEKQDLRGPEPGLVAQTSSGTFLAFWPTGLYEWTMLKDQTTEWLMRSSWFPSYWLRPFFDQIGFWGIGIPIDPILKLVALPLSAEDDNVLAVEIDDSRVAINDSMCSAVSDSLIPLARGAALQREAGMRSIFMISAFWLFRLLIGIFLLPKVVTNDNIDEYLSSSDHENCRLEMFAQYHHYYGGTSGAVDESFQIIPGLFVSDASAIASALPGGLGAATMEFGMRVADSLLAKQT
jgi:GMC oxidoreductase